MHQKIASLTVQPNLYLYQRKNVIYQICLTCKSLITSIYNCTSTYFNTSINSKQERNAKVLLTFVFCVSFQLCQLTNNILNFDSLFSCNSKYIFSGFTTTSTKLYGSKWKAFLHVCSIALGFLSLLTQIHYFSSRIRSKKKEAPRYVQEKPFKKFSATSASNRK